MTVRLVVRPMSILIYYSKQIEEYGGVSYVEFEDDADTVSE